VTVGANHIGRQLRAAIVRHRQGRGGGGRRGRRPRVRTIREDLLRTAAENRASVGLPLQNTGGFLREELEMIGEDESEMHWRH